MSIGRACLLVVCAAAGAGLAQAPPAAFDTATITLLPPLPAGTTLSRINLGNYYKGRLTMEDVTLSEMLRFAYALTSEDQVSGPDWIKSRQTRYAVEARTAEDVTLPQARMLTQKLLADRLKVVIRKESKAISFMALVQASGGSKLVEADPIDPRRSQATYPAVSSLPTRCPCSP
jgi:uncharacterized protein (TIGR03435 family)